MSTRVGSVEVGGVRTPLLEAGPEAAREAVVLVHGNPGSGEDWTTLVAACGEAGLRAIAPTLPGFGGAPIPAGWPGTTHAYAAHLGGVIDALGLKRVHLVLHDYGGPWGTEWLVANPDRHASTVSINAAIAMPRWHLLARVWRRAGLGEAFMATTTRAAFRALLAFTDPKLGREHVDRMHAAFSPETRALVLKLYRSTDLPGLQRAWIPRMRANPRPGLVVWGDRDKYIPVEVAAHQRDLLQAPRVVWLPGSGHWGMLERPDEVAEAVVPFLASVHVEDDLPAPDGAVDQRGDLG